MQIVIDIPEEVFKKLVTDKVQYGGITARRIFNMVKEGTPLTEVLEDIKTDIEGLKHEHTDVSGYRWWDNAIDNALSTIDRHIGEGSE